MPDQSGRSHSRSSGADVNGCDQQDSDGTPCTRVDHDGDHENWYAQRTWKAGAA